MTTYQEKMSEDPYVRDLRTALAASQDRERVLTEANGKLRGTLEAIVGNGGSWSAAYARAALAADGAGEGG